MIDYTINAKFPVNFQQIKTKVTLTKSPIVAGQHGEVVYAVWDTGATKSSISQRVINALKLTPVGRGYILSPGGSGNVNTYNISVIFPSDVCMKDLIVTDSPMDTCDFLIGMDIIAKGNFKLMHVDDHLEFSFEPVG